MLQSLYNRQCVASVHSLPKVKWTTAGLWVTWFERSWSQTPQWTCLALFMIKAFNLHEPIRKTHTVSWPGWRTDRAAKTEREKIWPRKCIGLEKGQWWAGICWRLKKQTFIKWKKLKHVVSRLRKHRGGGRKWEKVQERQYIKQYMVPMWMKGNFNFISALDADVL